MAGGDDQALGNAAELGGVANVESIEKHGSAVGIHRDFYFRGHCRHYEASVLDHLHVHELLFSGMQHYVLREVHVAVLADCDFVLAGDVVARVGSFDKKRQAGKNQSAVSVSNSHVLGASQCIPDVGKFPAYLLGAIGLTRSWAGTWEISMAIRLLAAIA